MRLAPVPLFFFPDRDAMIFYAGESSRTTHGAQECVDACRLFASILYNALVGMDKEQVLFEHDETIIESPAIREILKGSYKGKIEDQIQGTGYVVKSMEAALWCFYITNTFKEAVLKAANLGDDADTTAAICGQVAGAYYGISSIPSDWLKRVYMNQRILGLIKQLLARKT